MAERDDNNTILDGASDPIQPIDFTPREEQTRRFSYQPRWLHLFLAMASIVVAVAVWFVLTARSVSVEVDPITAEIEIEGGLNFRLGQRYLIRSRSLSSFGSTNPGYHDTETQLLVGTEQNQIHEFEMRRLPGRVTIRSAGLDGTRVQIDGVDIGVTPLVDAAIEPGTHQLTLSRDRYLEHNETIEIEGRQVEQSFSAELNPAWAVVDFTTSPPRRRSTGGWGGHGHHAATEILQGQRDVTLKLGGHKAWQDDFDIIAGEDFSVPTVELEPADGLVFIRSNPSAASVTVNGEFQGLTPVEVALPPGWTTSSPFSRMATSLPAGQFVPSLTRSGSWPSTSISSGYRAGERRAQ